MKRHLLKFLAAAALLCALPLAAAPPPGAGEKNAPNGPPPTLAKATAGLEKRAGLLTIYIDPKKGKVWLEVPPAKEKSGEVVSYIYQESIATGLGSNPVGLDRG